MHKAFLIILFMLSLLISACDKPQNEASTDGAQKQVDTSAAVMQSDDKNAYNKEVSQKIGRLEAKIDDLDTIVRGADSELQAELFPKLGQLRTEVGNLKSTLDQFTHDATTTLDNNEAVEAEWQQLQRSFAKLSDEIEAKI